MLLEEEIHTGILRIACCDEFQAVAAFFPHLTKFCGSLKGILGGHENDIEPGRAMGRVDLCEKLIWHRVTRTRVGLFVIESKWVEVQCGGLAGV